MVKYIGNILLPLALLVFVAAASCGHADGTAVDTTNTSVAMVSAINTLRTNSGQTAFIVSPTLSAIAQAQADFNNTSGVDGTVSAGGVPMEQQLVNAGFTASAQTFLVGSGTQTSVFSDLNGTNNVSFTDGTFTEIGVGTAGAGATQRWVVILATPDEANP